MEFGFFMFWKALPWTDQLRDISACSEKVKVSNWEEKKKIIIIKADTQSKKNIWKLFNNYLSLSFSMEKTILCKVRCWILTYFYWVTWVHLNSGTCLTQFNKRRRKNWLKKTWNCLVLLRNVTIYRSKTIKP